MDLQDRLTAARHRIQEACRRSGRNPEELRIIAITKYTTLEVTEQILQLGVSDIGESRWQDARTKWQTLGALGTWHFIGHLQTNKVKDVVGKFDYIHSLDRLSLAEEIEKKAAALQTAVNCFIQVNVSGEQTKQGVSPEGLFTFAEQIAGMEHLRIAGLMTMAPHEADPEATRPVFKRLRELRGELNARSVLKYEVTGLSMGMSNDFEVAVEEGATWLRLGSVLFGS
ncbi:YggS family pyridoxal phosphate-dependent enzyme [Paenibacillus ehimensis]|uniref:Pyridoxal phosphate homeostasis protein n=1 Tax=Paenibacillus ehimensis TaxID=79264 RepID=A0ABT8V5S9_9BACL|nr:YggS family pyridoxal phosphate-dependent enzyme [Paenibacillus ehimensis]MDO3676783.1 YggS family pyridoxal phosphate-dependent enzyme [Paenibacillus ehimensis]